MKRLEGSVSPAVLGFALIYPAAFTWLYYDILQGAPGGWQQLAFVAGKSLQLLLPFFVLWRGGRGLAAPRGRAPAGLRSIAVVFGLLVAAGAVLLVSPLSPLGGEAVGSFAAQLEGRLAEFSLTGPLEFALLGLFYSVLHSLFEEFYWRHFVHQGLRRRLGKTSATIISSVGFAAHHAVLLSVLLGGFSPTTWLLAGGVAVGGTFWAWLYEKANGIRWPWISHGLVDAGLFMAGYVVLFDLWV